MKKRIALTTMLLVFFVSLCTTAQNNDSNNGFGIKGGLNYATVTKGNFD